jgi:hypothetical protein
MRNSQRGITVVGAIILATFIGLFVYAGIRLTPLYIEYMNVARAMERLKSESSGGETANSLRTSLDKRFNIDYIDSVSAKDIEITRDGGNWILKADYDATAPFFANVSFLVHFEKTVSFGANTGT